MVQFTTFLLIQDRDDWNDIRRRVVTLLGTLGPDHCSLLRSCDDDTVEQVVMAWQDRDHLKLKLPTSDGKMIVNFKAFLPRISQLVNSNGNFKKLN